MHRRWQAEINLLGPCAQREGNNVILFLLSIDNKHAVLRFDRAACNYPFRPVKVSLKCGNNFVDYFNMLSTLHEDPNATQLMEETYGKSCVVCDSVLCPAKWTPQTKLVQVRDEITKGLRLKLRYADRLMARLLMPRVQRLDEDVWGHIGTFL